MAELPTQDTCSGRVNKIKRGFGNPLVFLQFLGLLLLVLVVIGGFLGLIFFGVTNFFNECGEDGHSVVYCVFDLIGALADP